MKISLVMPIYQFTEELAQLTSNTFESIAKTKGKEDLELVLIDNGSPVGEDLIKGVSDFYIRNSTNLGYCKAVNQGFGLARGDLVAVVNNDTKISENWLVVAKEIFASDPKIGTLHFKMVGYDDPFNFGNDVWVGGKERWCHASFYIIRKEAIPEGGYFEGYTAGGYDDYDFFHRMRDINGWKQAYTNKAVFQHKDSSTYIEMDKVDNDRARRDAHNRELYKERFGEYPDQQFADLFPEQMRRAWKPFP